MAEVLEQSKGLATGLSYSTYRNSIPEAQELIHMLTWSLFIWESFISSLLHIQHNTTTTTKLDSYCLTGFGNTVRHPPQSHT